MASNCWSSIPWNRFNTWCRLPLNTGIMYCEKLSLKGCMGQTLNCQMVISFCMVKEMLLIISGQT